MADIRKYFINKFGGTEEQLNTFMDQIKRVESNNQDIPQKGGGPGRGFYQFEKTAKNKKGEYVQAGAMTARNRLKNLYVEMGEKHPEWLDKQEGMRDPSIGFDVLGLSPEQQDSLFLADFYYKKIRGLNKEQKKNLIKNALESGNAREAWVHGHWAGPEEDVEEKLAQFDRNVKIGGSIANNKLVEASKDKKQISFSDAFKKARSSLGAGKEFEFEGKMYSTNTREDKIIDDMKQKEKGFIG